MYSMWWRDMAYPDRVCSVWPYGVWWHHVDYMVILCALCDCMMHSM